MFITAALVIAVLMLAAEKHQATPFAPVYGFLGPFQVRLMIMFTRWGLE